MDVLKRTATCGELDETYVGKSVTLNGWVHRNRDHGGIHFINLRDRYGITQVVIDEDAPDELKNASSNLKLEYCIAIEGTVRARPEEMVNTDMSTGKIEVAAERITVLSESDPLPFMIDDRSDARDELRLKYRYLDLRSFSMQRKIRLRHEVTFAIREYLTKQGFLEIETPTFIKSTPEGARDFLVPARLHPGKFYALPQSPQLFKQILMVSGMDKYFQIARCYRDEDARGDRQLEFTQVDIEMSFVSKEEVFAVTEGMMAHAFKSALDIDLELPFKRISYEDAMNKYGSDKPDLRFGLELQDFAAFVPKSEFNVFKLVLESAGSIKALVVPGCADYSRKKIDNLEKVAKIYGAKGLAWMKVRSDSFDGGVSRFFEDQRKEIISALGAKDGDLILCVGDSYTTACTALGAVRVALGKELGLVRDEFNFSWVVDFPMFEYNDDEDRWETSHHMFTMPQEQYLDTLESDPGSVKGDLYDLVLNGNELASGSIRIHDPAIQKKIFSIVGFSEEVAEERFGFLLEAFKYGPPPHGGIAPGLDRLVMLMAGEETIREVIPFPKNTTGISPMDDSPSEVDQEQLDSLFLELKIPEDQK